MNHPTCALAVLAAMSVMCASVVAADGRSLAAAQFEKSKPGVRWDRATLVDGDFNGDGSRDYAMVGYQGERSIVLAVRASSGPDRTYRNDFQAFGIGPSIQAAICGAPAVLEVEQQFCRPMDEDLPGCKPSKAANSLTLRGGDCDAIHLFWNHKNNRLEWWRL
jgi:hypothetical protein